jgi:hypothetical protein
MDPFSAAVIAWLTGQALTAGQDKLVRLLGGDTQQNALRKIVMASIGPAVAAVANPADRDLIEEALVRAGPDSAVPESGDVASKYLGSVQKLSGDYPAATASLNRALGLYQELGSGRGQADALRYLRSMQNQTGRVSPDRSG